MSTSRKRPYVRLQLVAAVAATLAIAVPITAGATGGGGDAFSDVPLAHSFYDEITWLEGVEVTGGFPDGTYRPGQAVTRGSMAAFMQRLYDVQDDMSWSYGTAVQGFAGLVDVFSPVPGAQTVVVVPEGAHANISARFNAETRCLGASSWCSVRITISKDGGAFQEMYPPVGMEYAWDSAGDDSWEGHAVERLFSGVPGSVYTIRVEAGRSGGAVTLFELDDWSLVAETDLQPSYYLPS